MLMTEKEFYQKGLKGLQRDRDILVAARVSGQYVGTSRDFIKELNHLDFQITQYQTRVKSLK